MALPGILATALLALPPLTAGTAGLQTPAAEEQDALIDSFRAELQRLRAGEDDALTPLQELADRLCADFDRCDTIEGLGYYAQLPPRARLAGLDAERRYLALRGRVIQARRDDLFEEWPDERDEILIGLRELVLEVEVGSDYVPAAKALVLCAQIEVHSIEENGPFLSDAERAAAIDGVADDVRDANVLFEHCGQVVPRLELYLVLGRLERLREQPVKARELFERCYEESRRLRNDASAADALNGLLMLAIDAGDVVQQERELRRLAAYRAPTESWLVTRGWGQLLLNANHPERALEFMRQHAPQDEVFPDDRRDWHLLMGGAMMRLGMHSEARDHFGALEEDLYAGTLARLALARLALEEGRPDEALARLEEPDFREELPSDDLAIWHALAGEARLEAEGPTAALGDLQRAVELSDALGPSPLGEAETTARSVLGPWMGLHTVALLADVHARLGRPLDALAAIEDSQSRSLRRIESELQRVRANAGLSETGALVTRGEVLSWARHAELGLVTWVVGADFTLCAWAVPQVDQQGDQTLRADAERVDLSHQRLEDGVRRLREAAVGGDDAAVRRIAGELRDSLLPAELLQRLRDIRELGDPDARLLVLLHGPLERLPVELFELDGVPFDRFLTVLALPGLPATQPGPEPTLDHDRWVLAGAPTDIDPWPQLPGARQEIADLGALYAGSRTVVGADFTLPAMRAVLRGLDPLHVATHLVEECEHPGRRLAPVSLLLSGGELLCTHDVADIGPRTPLVILSACATAEGRYLDGEGLTGLARAFLESGTRNVLVTLWPVEDRAAQAFAKAFHGVLAGGVQPSRAAREAREALRAEGWGPAAVGAFRVLGRD